MKVYKEENNIFSKSLKKGLSLSFYLNEIVQTISNNFKKPEWVTAEISKITQSKGGHYFLELVETDKKGKIIAKSEAVIWGSISLRVLDVFYKATGNILSKDMKVLILVKPSYHPLYGLKLTIQDVDPNYTLGDVMKKIAMIRETLQEEGIYDNNLKKAIPRDFRNVAVISPKDGAGLGDFQKEADVLDKNNLCKFHYYTAFFQGKKAAIALADTLEKIKLQHNKEQFNALVIIRGGGSVADLGWLNDLEVAKQVCLFPIPVFVGIGHRRDFTILDEIARIRFDTPSKVASHIFSTICRNMLNIEEWYLNIAKQAKQNVLEVTNGIERCTFQILARSNKTLMFLKSRTKELFKSIFSSSDLIVVKKEQKIRSLKYNNIIMAKSYYSYSAQLLKNTYYSNVLESGHLKYALSQKNVDAIFRLCIERIKGANNAAFHNIELLLSIIMGYNPEKVLDRGFVYIRGLQDKHVTTRKMAMKEQVLKIVFKDGVLEVKPKN